MSKILLINLIIFSFTSVYSEDIFDLSIEDLKNMNIESVSNKIEKLSDSPANITIINSDQIKRRGYKNLEELLYDTPEVEIHRYAQSEFNNLISVRGIIGSERLVILYNGIRVSPPDGNPIVLKGNYPIENAERVEIILSPNSAIYGADAFSGFINIVTENDNDNNSLTVNSDYGSFKTTNNSISSNLSFDEIKFTFFGNFNYTKGPDLYKYYPDEFGWYNNNYRKDSTLLSNPFEKDTLKQKEIYDFDLEEKTYNFFFNLDFKNSSVGFIRNVEQHNSGISVKPEYGIYNNQFFINTWQNLFYFKNSFTINKINISSQISFNSYQMNPESNFNNLYTSYEKGYKYSYSDVFNIWEQINYDYNDKAFFTLGVQFQSFNSLPKTGDLPFLIDKNVPLQLQDIYYIGTDSYGDSLKIYQDFYYLRYYNLGLYFQTQYKFNENFILSFGSRFDNNSRYGFTYNPKLALVSHPHKDITMKLIYGKAFIAPSPYKSFQHYGSFVADSNNTFKPGFWHLPNPDLKPEIINTLDFNFFYQPLTNYGFSLVTYFNYLDNLMKNETFINGSFKGYNIQFGDKLVNKGISRTYGATLKSFLVFNIIDNLNCKVNIAYSYTDGDIEGNPLSFNAKNSFKSSLEFNFNNFDVSIQTNYRGKSYHSFSFEEINKNGDLFAPAFVICNLRINKSFNLDKYQLMIYTQINNLFDNRYYDLTVGTVETFGNRNPQSPINFLVGINLNLQL